MYKTTRFSAVYAYRLNVTDNLALKLGVEAGMHQTNLNWDKLLFPDQIDPIGGPGGPTGELRPDATNNTQLDISPACSFSAKNFISARRLNTSTPPAKAFCW
ncbi:MAG: type IX secretion system membrane protein PorP/SprF [Lewinellaceae bacterium]|nr:type IX secretion system membrane protein PorP/SprF [Lewinellaceae bacterium]